MTPGHLLDKFIEDFLQPNQTFQDQIKNALKTICSFLEENCFQHSTTKIQVIQVSPGLFLCSWRGTKQSLGLGKGCDHRKCEGRDAGGKLGRSMPETPALSGGCGGTAPPKSFMGDFGAGHMVCLEGSLFPYQVSNPGPMALSANRWTTREFPLTIDFRFCVNLQG